MDKVRQTKIKEAFIEETDFQICYHKRILISLERVKNVLFDTLYKIHDGLRKKLLVLVSSLTLLAKPPEK